MDQRGMGDESPGEIALQLPDSVRQKAAELAARDAISLEDFILIAVSEKIALSEPSRDESIPIAKV